MHQECIVPSCGLKYSVKEARTACDRGHLLDIRYAEPPAAKLKEVFLERRNHRGNIFNESGVWRYRELLNFTGVDTEEYESYRKLLVSLDGGEGHTKPYKMSKVAKEYTDSNSESLYLQPEGLNPSGSFKDNGICTGLTAAKMLGVRKMICASTGNTSASLAMYAANEGLEARVYVPKGQIAPGKLAQAFQFGAEIVQVEGDFDAALETVLSIAKNEGAYVMNSINPFRLEGQKTVIFRALEYFDWNVPDWIVWPGGNLGNSAAFGKGLSELYDWGFIKKKPRVAVVNAEGANTLYMLHNGLYDGRRLVWNSGRYDEALIQDYYSYLKESSFKAETVASAIKIMKPVNLPKCLRTLEQFNGVVTQVSDSEMLDAMAIVGMNGFDCEPASGATVAGIKTLVEKGVIAKDDMVLGILTGRLKDPDLIAKYHLKEGNRFAKPPRVHAE